MRKLSAFILTLSLVFVFSACGGDYDSGFLNSVTDSQGQTVSAIRNNNLKDLFSKLQSRNHTAYSNSAYSSREDFSSFIASSTPTHSPYYLPGYTADRVADYFCEVVLDAEDKHDPNNISNFQVKKWLNPITYCIMGSPTGEDLITLNGFLDELRLIYGIPEISETKNPQQANCTINFCSKEYFFANCPADQATQGYVNIWWYNNDLQIYKSEILLRTDVPQSDRNKVIQHEFYQSLGMLQDTARADSIIYSGGITAQRMNELDKIILKLLYSDEIKPFMDRARCIEIIKRMYY